MCVRRSERLHRISRGRTTARTSKGHSNIREARKGLDELAKGQAGRPPIHPQYLAKLVNEHATDDAIFTADTGTLTIWAAHYLRMNGRRRLIGSWVHGSMANAMAQAIGAQGAYPGRQVVSLSGDGGFAMLMGDFLTLTQLGLPVKVIVFNNGSLGFVELEMRTAGFLETGVELKNPDFAAMARAAGVSARRVEDPGDLPEAVADILAHPGPALLDAVVNRQELAIPPAVTGEQMKGSSLYVLKAVMTGRGDAIVDLAKTNLFADGGRARFIHEAATQHRTSRRFHPGVSLRFQDAAHTIRLDRRFATDAKSGTSPA